MGRIWGRRGIGALGLVWVIGCGGDSPGAEGSSTSGGSSTTTGTTSGTTTGQPTTTTDVPTSSTTVEEGSSTTGIDTFDMMTDPGTGGVMMTGSSSGDGETTGAPDPFCGDGDVDRGEECDDGPGNDDAGACTLACTLAACGDGHLQAGEQCDDGNAENEDSCVEGCELNVCGDGFVGPGEACDDPLDPLCTEACALASCGDGKVQPGEQCDDANDVDSDACLATCLMASCGDGAVQEGVEACDDGNGADSDACTSLCEPPACDDGIKSGNESDVDCGGACTACEAGQACTKGSECGTNVCKEGLCVIGASCQEIRNSSPMAKNGLYTVDLDGDGPEPQQTVECEMETDGGGWTLVQRTVWDPAKTAGLFTGYADWYTKTIGAPTPGEGYRLAGKLWTLLNVKKRHMLIHRMRKAQTGESCSPLYYVGSEGTLVIDDKSATLTGLLATVNMVNNTVLSTQNSGPSSSCVNTHSGAPWFYSSCCSTCPTFAGGYWPVPHPMASYTASAPDQYAQVQSGACDGEAVIVSQGYYGINDMAYYLR